MNCNFELLGRDRRWTFWQQEIRIGRDPACDLALAPEEFPGVSRFHALARERQGAFWIEDQGSTGGTYRNCERVDQARLATGDVLRLGPDGPELRVRFSPASVSDVAPTVTGEAPTPPPGRIPSTTTGGVWAPRSTRPNPQLEETLIGEEPMLEAKLNTIRNLLVAVTLLCLGLVGVVVYQGQEIRRNREAVNHMQRRAENAVGQFMPQLNQRLNRFDVRLDSFQGQMDSLDGNMKKSEDRFVRRLNDEMPKIMDRYLALKAEEIKKGARARIEVR